MKKRLFGGALVLGVAMFSPTEGFTQSEDDGAVSDGAAAATAETPANGTPENEVPPVEVVQPKPEPAPAPAQTAEPRPQPRPRPAPRPVVSAPPAPVEPAYEPIEPELDASTLITQPFPEYYGPPGGLGNYERSLNSAQSPINPLNGIAPGNLQDFSEAGSRVTRQQINEQDPYNTNDILQRVPGVTIVNDDGGARNGGIGIRGSNPRRSRKILVMEDGQSINMSLYIDPSVHHVPPPERIEAVEVIKGSIVYAPNNNFGAVNFVNLQPFGPNETVVSSEGGGAATDGPLSLDDDGSSTKWHVHNRQTSGNWGTVVSYTGANMQGAWDTERLRYNDFYAALGWKNTKADFVLSGSYTRQRDNYDEANLEIEDEDEEEGDLEEDEALEEEEEEFEFANAEEALKFFKHCKTCFNPGSALNTYNADPFRLQGTFNYYLDMNTTLTSRVYYMHHRRDRYQNFEGADPRAAEDDFSPLFVGDDEALIPEGVMVGRLRTYQHIGAEERLELANRPFFGGLAQDLQMGVRFEHHTFKNRNFFGDQGEVLEDGDKQGFTTFDSEHETDAFSAYLQTVIHATPALDIVPGIRFEHFNSKVKQLVASEEEGEGEEELEECEFGGREFFEGEECVVFELERDDKNFSFNKTYWLPGISFSYGLFGKQTGPVDYHTTMYGGYNRGVTIPVQREGPFPPEDELGDNYQLGIRSTGVRGVTLDAAGFWKRIQNYQIKGAATTAAGQNVFTSADLVEIPGFEMYGRLDSRPFTGWDINPFAEGTFTYTDGEIVAGVGDGGARIVGNFIPFAPREVAYLTAGIESTAGWNASVSFVYRGEFFTDVENTPFKGDPEGENGLVPSVWLLNARANYTVPQNLMPNADLVLFVSGQNLTDEFYITDREDGVKPGIGRTLMAGARLKW
jgi:Fe(3+) dicitrate transport protein